MILAEAAPQEGRTLKRLEILVLALITAAGAAVRFLNLGDLPLGAAGTEEGTSWLATSGLLQHGYPLLPSGVAYWKGVPYTLLAGAFSGLFGLSSWSLRVPSALAGVVSIPVAWWAARSVLRRLSVAAWPAALGGLFAAYLLAFSQWCVLMSRWGRFYSMGLTLFLLGVGLAASAFSPSRPPSMRSVALFGALLLAAAATFHPGGLLLIAVLAAWVLGTRFEAGHHRTLAVFTAATAFWFAGVLFLWKSGHVGAASGWRDLHLMVGLPFWKHMTLLLVLGFGGWAAIARARGRRIAALSIGALVLLEMVVFVAAGLKGVDTGALQGFRVLALGHPGLMLLAFAGTIGLALAAWRASPEGRRAAGILWLMTVVPIAIIGASTGNFVPRYLLFTFGPLAVCAAAGVGLLLDAVRRPALRLASAAVLLPTALWLVSPTVSPITSLDMLDHRIGEPWPPLLACSPSRAYALDLESPSRYVAERMSRGDLVVSTARSIPEAIIGHMDYFFRIPSASNTLLDESGGPFNILTGCPMLSNPDQVIRLCADARVFVILDERALHLEEVRALKKRLVDILGGPDFTAGEYAEVYVLPPGCGGAAVSRL